MEEHTQDSITTIETTSAMPNTASASTVESKPLSHNASQEVSVYANRPDLEYTHHGNDDATDIDANSEASNGLSFNLPTYGYDQYVMDIANWQRQRVSMGAEPGYYFFKIFFNFNTNYGLLGGLMSPIGDKDEHNTVLKSKNTAFGYLKTVVAVHKYDNVKERMLALSKFAISLKDISLRTPWLFKTLSGLNTINSTYVNNFDKEKIITIGCGQETVDSRIGTMMDLYKFACFDQVNCKEIIPPNLRKFEMSIIVYHMPLSAYHRKAITMNGQNFPQIANQSDDGYKLTLGNDNRVIESKNMYDKDNFSNMMSFKLFTFLNCEIDCDNANEYYTDGMSNEQPFQLGNNQIKIKYDRVYEHRMSEWTQMFFGSDGFYYNRYVPGTLKGNVTVGSQTYDFEIQSQNEKNDLHKLRLDKLKATYENSQMNIMDYQKLLINAYYTPFDLNPTKINEVSLSGMQNAYIEKLRRIRNLFIP